MSEIAPWLILEPTLKALLTANQMLHSSIRRHTPITNIPRYLRDFRTIRLNYGQRTGKSIALQSLAVEGDLVLVQNGAMIPFVQPRCRGAVHALTELGFPATAEQLKSHTWPRVWLDNTTFVSPAIQSDLYEDLGKSIDQQFIFLG